MTRASLLRRRTIASIFMLLSSATLSAQNTCGSATSPTTAGGSWIGAR